MEWDIYSGIEFYTIQKFHVKAHLTIHKYMVLFLLLVLPYSILPLYTYLYASLTGHLSYTLYCFRYFTFPFYFFPCLFLHCISIEVSFIYKITYCVICLFITNIVPFLVTIDLSDIIPWKYIFDWNAANEFVLRNGLWYYYFLY